MSQFMICFFVVFFFFFFFAHTLGKKFFVFKLGMKQRKRKKSTSEILDYKSKVNSSKFRKKRKISSWTENQFLERKNFIDCHYLNEDEFQQIQFIFDQIYYFPVVLIQLVLDFLRNYPHYFGYVPNKKKFQVDRVMVKLLSNNKTSELFIIENILFSNLMYRISFNSETSKIISENNIFQNEMIQLHFIQAGYNKFQPSPHIEIHDIYLYIISYKDVFIFDLTKTNTLFFRSKITLLIPDLSDYKRPRKRNKLKFFFISSEKENGIYCSRKYSKQLWLLSLKDGQLLNEFSLVYENQNRVEKHPYALQSMKIKLASLCENTERNELYLVDSIQNTILVLNKYTNSYRINNNFEWQSFSSTDLKFRNKDKISKNILHLPVGVLSHSNFLYVNDSYEKIQIYSLNFETYGLWIHTLFDSTQYEDTKDLRIYLSNNTLFLLFQRGKSSHIFLYE